MKTIRIITSSLFVLTTIVVLSGLIKSSTSSEKMEILPVKANNQKQTVNLFVTHGHCNTPFSGIVENLKVITSIREDQGNPLENMKISFDIDPNSFVVCVGDELTAKIKTPGLFIGEIDEKITFRSTNVYTVGMDWYQVNGKISIKGVAKDVKLFVTGIRDPKESVSTSLVLEGQMNLFDWGIDYDKIVNGNLDLFPSNSDSVSSKWLHINMKIDLS